MSDFTLHGPLDTTPEVLLAGEDTGAPSERLRHGNARVAALLVGTRRVDGGDWSDWLPFYRRRLPYNEAHLVCLEFLPGARRLHAAVCEYALVQTLRERFRVEVPLITTNAFLHCRERQQVVLQVRQGSLYGNGEAGLFGGGMQAFGPHGREGDGNLLTALQRELREETGGVIDQAAIGRAPLWWATEHRVGDRLTGSLQFNRYGVPITADTLDRLLDLQRQQPPEEGGILVMDVRDLADWLAGQQPGPAPGVGARLGLSAWLKNPPA
jgi:8-oxo-dGTP pyrophosphatase MutT (NUDIX family)